MKSSCALILLIVLLANGCSSPSRHTYSANAIRVVDYSGMPIKNAYAHFSYDVPYTIAYLEAGPTDEQGYAQIPSPYHITEKSRVTVRSEESSASLNYRNLGFVMNGLLNLTIPRASSDLSAEGSINLPSIYISKESEK